ncbi:MAG TPA: mechanosensitive ion channel domain-containing protein, partial [Kiloniellales bacterium]
MNGSVTADKFLEFFAQAGNLVVQYGLDLLGAVVLLIGGWILAGWARRNVLRLLDRTPHLDAMLKPIVANTTRYAILVLVVVAVLAQFGVQTASIIAVLGAAGLAIGLAMQGTLQNIAAGIMLLFLRPFRINDYIDAEGIAGTVDEVGLFTTRMRTFDGVYQEVPNSQLWNRTIKNYSRLPTRRLDIDVGISYNDDIDTAQSVLLDLLRQDTRVLAEPAPQVLVEELAESSVNLNLRCWTKADDYWSVLFET